MYNLIKAEAAFLDPDSGTRASRVHKCKCRLCGEKVPLNLLFEIDLGMVCEECVDEHTYTYDVYPEYEDEHLTCCVCGDLCEDQVTLIGRDPYCKDCLEEAKLA